MMIRLRPALSLVLCSLAASVVPAAAQERSEKRPFVQAEAGALNPNEVVQATLAFGLAGGFDWRRYSLVVHLTRQSQNRNSGSDLTSDARTFATLSFERRFGSPHGWPLRQAFVRLDIGAVFRSPFKTAFVTGLGLGWRQSLMPHLRLVGTLFDDVAWLSEETFACAVPPFGYPGSCRMRSGPQHNFGGTAALQLHL
jgi:hypothetical protein